MLDACSALSMSGNLQMSEETILWTLTVLTFNMFYFWLMKYLGRLIKSIASCPNSTKPTNMINLSGQNFLTFEIHGSKITPWRKQILQILNSSVISGLLGQLEAVKTSVKTLDTVINWFSGQLSLAQY